MITPEALARVLQRRMDSCGAHKKFSEHCSDCAHVRALEAALAALTPAPAQGEQPDFSSGAQARITAQQEARRKKPTPPPPEPEGEEC